MKAKTIVVSMTAAVAALGSHANDEAARAALADMAAEYPNIISMADRLPDFGPFAA